MHVLPQLSEIIPVPAAAIGISAVELLGRVVVVYLPHHPDGIAHRKNIPHRNSVGIVGLKKLHLFVLPQHNLVRPAVRAAGPKDHIGAGTLENGAYVISARAVEPNDLIIGHGG